MSLGLLTPLGDAIVSWGLGSSEGTAPPTPAPSIPCPEVYVQAASLTVVDVAAVSHTTAQVEAGC